MRLTVYTDYSLRVLIYLGVQDQRLATIREIADRYGISNNHLLKVVHRLGLLGYVETIRGKNGGIRLAKRPEDIVIGDVVRQAEQDFSVVQCQDAEGPYCKIFPACTLKTFMEDAVEAFLAVLDGRSLADLIRPAVQLRSLLQDSAPAEGGMPPSADSGPA